MERDSHHRELGDFLRRHREQKPPGETQRPGSYRRAKGLRRSEVASRVGISEQWYTLLEQGRTRFVSAQVLVGLADVFDLSPAEIEHLFALAGKPPPAGLHSGDPTVPDVLLRFLEAQSPYPAYIHDHRWDTLASNEGARAIFPALAGPQGEACNFIRALFTVPEVRDKLVDWSSTARIVLSFFRRDYGRNPGDPRLKELVADLQEASEEFREWWTLQQVNDHATVRFSYAFADGVGLDFDRLTFIDGEDPRLRVIVLVPAPGTDTDRSCQRLVAEYRELRAAGTG
jgi:transcriptional regulator with XRE-family HTH domain